MIQSTKPLVIILLRAADAGDIDLLLLLAECYDDGVGGSGDAAKAVECYERAAKLGSADAKVLLAAAYEFGLGVKPGTRSARLLWSAKRRIPAQSARHDAIGGLLSQRGLSRSRVPKRQVSCIAAPSTRAISPPRSSWALRRTGAAGKPDPVRAAELYGNRCAGGRSRGTVLLAAVTSRGSA